ncbi:MAG: cysteine--tRNA ligase [Ruminococcaceae bacterium]|nr:cysteine--tRNA ligase [Oscillospiraceae bacterium]
MKIFNTLTMQKEEFKPLEENKVKIYACGPTVYNYFHLGNARPFIIFDTLRRYFEYRGYDVKFVQNFTDIDDKMIKRANEEGITVRELADRFIKEYYTDAKGLGVKEADVHPRATDVIPQIIKMCETLIEKGYAYEVNGDVYFETKKFKNYGKLSHQPLEDLEAGARINVNEDKKDPMDFAIWKAKKEGEPAWECPWGEGRPGWHIECSAMVNEYLGKTIDIHCGGKDLSFPHHENEIAQSEAANGVPFANYWMHNGYINIDNRKMSKSLGNFFTVRDLAEKFPYDVLRFFMLSAHYRSPINFSDELLEQAKTGLGRIVTCMKNLEFLSDKVADTAITAEEQASLDSYREKFITAMDDDLNTAEAIGIIFELVREINTKTKENATKGYVEAAKAILLELTGVLNIAREEESSDVDVALIEEKIAERTQAKKEKNFARADEIRAELLAMGIVIEDTREGVKWHKAD